MARAIGLLLVAVATGLLVYWLAAPHLLAPAPPSVPISQPTAANSGTPSAASASPSAPNTTPAEPSASAPISAPLTSQQQATAELETKRAPYYTWARRQAGDAIADLRPADDDGAVLLIYTSRGDPQLVTALMQTVVVPYAFRYGFRHVRLFLPNPPDSAERYRFYAEANSDDDGTWHTFLK